MDERYFLRILEAIPKEIEKNGQRFILTISFFPHPVFSYTAATGETYGVLRAVTLQEALAQTVTYLETIGAIPHDFITHVREHEPRHIGETEEYIDRIRERRKRDG